MWRMLQLDNPEDFVIATGNTYSLEDFVSNSFGILHLNWSDYVIQDRCLFRPTDILISRADSIKAKEKLGWEAQVTIATSCPKNA